MVSRKNHNHNANEGFVILLTSKLITCLNWWFHFDNETPSQLLIYSMEMNIYCGFWTLTPNACWLLEIRCVVRLIFAIYVEYGSDLAYGPGLFSASKN